MSDTQRDHDGSHAHGAGVTLEPEALGILHRGLEQLLAQAEGLSFVPTASQRHPLPLALLAYKRPPDPKTVCDRIRARMADDPVSVLEHALALLELIECNQPDISEYVLEDMAFVGTCFASKRCNGWICAVGDGDRGTLEQAINDRWQFKFYHGPARPTGLYAMLNMLGRYAFVYGRISPGDGHALAHFVEDHCPGLLVCHGSMTDLELTLSLAAMKMGLPAIVPEDYPFPLGRTIRADGVDEIAEAVVAFPNIRHLLNTPDVPGLPDYCDSENRKEKVTPHVTWGGTDESFYIVEKGPVASSACEVVGTPDAAIGIVVTIDAEPMDAMDREYIEQRIIQALAMIAGVGVQYNGDDLKINLAKGAELDGARIGEVLIAATRHEFPKLAKVHVEVIFDPARLAEMCGEVAAAKRRRRQEIADATEEGVGQFCGCVGCSPFAPDHVCVLTPERPPQCGRPLAAIKTGALYGYDDMSNIHHSRLHRQVNSFQVMDKGRCLDPVRGEWEGVNAAVSRLSHGRTTRVQLHCLDQFPHTGCGCFRLIMFTTDTPHDGIGIMAAGYEGHAPDGRGWSDLHYSLAGKQTPGVAGAAPNYLRSAKFLQAHGGWDAVVWVSPKIAAVMGDDLPDYVEVGPEIES